MDEENWWEVFPITCEQRVWDSGHGSQEDMNGTEGPNCPKHNIVNLKWGQDWCALKLNEKTKTIKRNVSSTPTICGWSFGLAISWFDVGPTLPWCKEVSACISIICFKGSFWAWLGLRGLTPGLRMKQVLRILHQLLGYLKVDMLFVAPNTCTQMEPRIHQVTAIVEVILVVSSTWRVAVIIEPICQQHTLAEGLWKEIMQEINIMLNMK